jgi:hypothetical protein
MMAHRNITDRARRAERRRFRPCAAQVSLGRSTAALIDAYDFMKGHRPNRGFAAVLLREVRYLESRALKVHEMITGIEQDGKLSGK